MTSKLVVNEIAADTGISTITVGDNMSGVTFKTGTSNLHNVGIEIAGINVLGADTPIGAGATIYNSGDVLVGGAVTATAFSGSGASLTGLTAGQIPNLDGAKITSGTVAAARIDNLAASKITSGTVATARLGSGTANSSSFLRGDSSWAAVTSTTINNNANNRIITGSGTANTLEGEANLTFDGDKVVVTQSAANIGFEVHSTGSGKGAQTMYHNDHGTTYVGVAGNTSGETHFYNASNTATRFYTNSAERLVIASDGTVIAGAASVSGGNRSQYSILAAVSNNTSATGHGVFTIQAGANSSSGNEVAQLCFSDPQGDYAWIQAFADAATGSTDKPGRLVFSTSADGAAIPTERLRITSAGKVGINETSPDSWFHVNSGSETVPARFESTGTQSRIGFKAGGTANTYNVACGAEAENFIVYTSNAEKLRITSDGQIKKAQGANVTSLKTYNSNADAFWLDHYQYQTSGTYQRYTDIVSVGDSSWGSNIRFFTNANGSANTFERLRIKSDSSMLHTRSDNVGRYDLEFRQTGGISDGNYGGIVWKQSSTGSTFLAGIQIAYADTGRPDMVFWIRDKGGSAGSDEGMRIDRDGKLSLGGDTDTYLDRNTTNTWQIKTNGTLCTEFSANQRVRMPQVYSTNGSSMRDVQVESDGTLCAGNTSIRAAKKNIAPQTDVSWLYDLNPVTFNYRKHTVDEVTGVNTYLEETLDETSYGLIAEEVETVKKDFCFYHKDEDGNDKLEGVSYKHLITPLLKALQDQKKEIDALKAEVDVLKSS